MRPISPDSAFIREFIIKIRGVFTARIAFQQMRLEGRKIWLSQVRGAIQALLKQGKLEKVRITELPHILGIREHGPEKAYRVRGQ